MSDYFKCLECEKFVSQDNANRMHDTKAVFLGYQCKKCSEVGV